MNLLLISVDSLRLDHAARASDGQVHTPRFQALTAGLGFTESCFSVSSATRPVHATLVTGLYPFEHGVQGQYDHRPRPGTTRLFDRLRQAGYRVGLFSEAASIFHGIDFGAPMQQLDRRASAGLARLGEWLKATGGAGRRCLFVHYWSTHAPYGAADGLAMGETARLVRSGRAGVVRERYRAAVENLFERGIAPLLEQIDLERWSIVIFGDHGESWVPDELYHGRTLRNSVLRVPLWIHAPGAARPAGPGPGEVVSLIDLHPTLCGLSGLGVEPGFGRDLTRAPVEPRYCLAEIRPGRDDEAPVSPRPDPPAAGTLWCVLDHRYKLLGGAQERELVDTWSEVPVPREGAAAMAEPYFEAREAMRRSSRWTGTRPEPMPAEPAETARLRRRLRALGYLD